MQCEIDKSVECERTIILLINTLMSVLRSILDIIQKLSRTDQYKNMIVDCNAHSSLVKLLWCQDITLLHCTLYALCDLAQRYLTQTYIYGLGYSALTYHLNPAVGKKKLMNIEQLFSDEVLNENLN